MVRGRNEVILKGFSNPSHSVVPCYLAYPGFDNLSVYFFSPFPLLCALASRCSPAADQRRCNLKLPGLTQNGASSGSAHQGMEMDLLVFHALAWAGIATRKKRIYFF